MNAGTADDRWFGDLSLEEQARKVLDFYRLALELSSYKSYWRRLLALTGNQSARMGQHALAEGETLAIRIVNSSPEFQSIWKRLCEQEPQASPAKPFLPSILRSTCIPLPVLPPEERLRRSAESVFFSNKCRKVIAEWNELAEHYRNGPH